MSGFRWVLWVPVLAGLTGAFAFSGTVTHVTDGDTVWVRPDGSRPVPVRLYGIDAPESCQAGGPEATEALATRVLRREVTVDSSAHDGYGRVVGTVWLRGEDIGAWLVAQGHAWSPGYRRANGPYADEERLARTRHRGLFAAPAIEPRQFRRDHGPCPRPPGKRQPATGR
ncbi:thermonuclease family protein [Rhizobacter sp. Root1221]|uniref:thermonuclease family protein n=1 Tax=Rhizobacter sp. Root1221 TaxID=1736433 RepID=UPI000714884A|nr:thermonuclease family protein [Rhizobacter sp. Root1221]KQV98029.1 hypothetical protein ASC87_22695 [Rhizobacter sp. Root1221]